MKTSLLLFTFIISAMATLYGQSADRFIRIVGNASRTVIADEWHAEFTISEVKTSEYRPGTGMGFEDAHINFLYTMKDLGVPEDAVQEMDNTPTKYNAGQQITYQVALTDQEQIKALLSKPIPGVRVQNAKYAFAPMSEAEEKEMALEAIEDARRKAKSLAHNIDQKLGKLLNIEDTSTGCCGEIRDAKESSITRTYHVNVTFQLKG